MCGLILEARSPRSRRGQAWLLLRPWGRHCPKPRPLLLVVCYQASSFWACRSIARPLPSSSYSPCVCFQISPFYKDTVKLDQGHPTDFILTQSSERPYFQLKSQVRAVWTLSFGPINVLFTILCPALSQMAELSPPHMQAQALRPLFLGPGPVRQGPLQAGRDGEVICTLGSYNTGPRAGTKRKMTVKSTSCSQSRVQISPHLVCDRAPA